MNRNFSEPNFPKLFPVTWRKRTEIEPDFSSETIICHLLFEIKILFMFSRVILRNFGYAVRYVNIYLNQIILNQDFCCIGLFIQFQAAALVFSFILFSVLLDYSYLGDRYCYSCSVCGHFFTTFRWLVDWWTFKMEAGSLTVAQLRFSLAAVF